MDWTLPSIESNQGPHVVPIYDNDNSFFEIQAASSLLHFPAASRSGHGNMFEDQVGVNGLIYPSAAAVDYGFGNEVGVNNFDLPVT